MKTWEQAWRQCQIALALIVLRAVIMFLEHR